MSLKSPCQRFNYGHAVVFPVGHFKCPVDFRIEMTVRGLKCPKAVLSMIYWQVTRYFSIFTNRVWVTRSSDLIDPILWFRPRNTSTEVTTNENVSTHLWSRFRYKNRIVYPVTNISARYLVRLLNLVLFVFCVCAFVFLDLVTIINHTTHYCDSYEFIEMYHASRCIICCHIFTQEFMLSLMNAYLFKMVEFCIRYLYSKWMLSQNLYQNYVVGTIEIVYILHLVIISTKMYTSFAIV